MGNRFEFLQKAVILLFEEVGSVAKISSVYETPALGFEGASFLNCVVHITSGLSPSQVLKATLQIEKKLGRQRKNEEGYVSRPIDIDILFVDEVIKTSKKLTIPHPEIANRKFVLQPLAEVNASLVHPILQKNSIKLLAETNDKSVITKQSKWLRNPIKDYSLSKYNYIAIEGNIGAGKTSLATKLAQDFNSKLILERFKDNPFLPKFYEEPSRFAFPLEMSFLADRYQQLLEDIAQYDLFNDTVIADYDAYKSLIFAKVTLQDEEYNLYRKLYHLMHKELAKPDIYIYLFQNTERLLENIKMRGRDYEKSIQAQYLKKINTGYLEYIKTLPQEKVKIIDVSEMDFVANRKDYLSVIKQLT